VAAQAARCW